MSDETELVSFGLVLVDLDGGLSSSTEAVSAATEVFCFCLVLVDLEGLATSSS